MSNDQFTQILRAINDVRTDLRDFKQEMNERWDKNDKRWEENDRRWEENNKRWEENDRRWEENNKRWDENNRLWKENAKKWIENQKTLDKINAKIERNYKGIFTVFEGYETSVEKMYQENKKKILAIQKQLKIANL